MNTFCTQYSNRYFLMRHGESLANRRGLIISSPENALNNYGLTARGAEQAMQAALSTRLGRDTIIVSSDYQRALETAEIMRSVIDAPAPISTDEYLRERFFGQYERREDDHYQEVWNHDVAHPDDEKNGVESVTATLTRTLQVITRLEHQFNDRSILLVGHGDVLQILLAYHHNIKPRFHRSLCSLGNADIRSLAKLPTQLSKSSA